MHASVCVRTALSWLTEPAQEQLFQIVKPDFIKMRSWSMTDFANYSVKSTETKYSHHQFAFYCQKRNMNNCCRLFHEILKCKVQNTMQRYPAVHWWAINTTKSSTATPKEGIHSPQLIWRGEHVPLGHKLASSCVQGHSAGLASWETRNTRFSTQNIDRYT